NWPKRMSPTHRRGERAISAIVAAVIIVVIIAAAAASYFLLAPTSQGNQTTTPKTAEVVFGATLSMTGPWQAFGQEQEWTLSYVGPVYTSVAKSCADCSNACIFSPFHNETNEAHIFFNWFRTVDPSTPSHNVTVAFFGEGDPAAQANNLGGEAYARTLGYTVCTCSDLTFRPGSNSEMTSFISAAKSAGAEAIYGLPIPPDAVLMVNTAHQLNYAPKAWLQIGRAHV